MANRINNISSEISEEREANNKQLENFSHCPRYAKHELSRDQIKEIVEEVYKQMKSDAFDDGKSILMHLIAFLGIMSYAFYSWISNHPFK